MYSELIFQSVHSVLFKSTFFVFFSFKVLNRTKGFIFSMYADTDSDAGLDANRSISGDKVVITLGLISLHELFVI